jgi:hypothetical protein
MPNSIFISSELLVSLSLNPWGFFNQVNTGARHFMEEENASHDTQGNRRDVICNIAEYRKRRDSNTKIQFFFGFQKSLN